MTFRSNSQEFSTKNVISSRLDHKYCVELKMKRLQSNLLNLWLWFWQVAIERSIRQWGNVRFAFVSLVIDNCPIGLALYSEPKVPGSKVAFFLIKNLIDTVALWLKWIHNWVYYIEYILGVLQRAVIFENQMTLLSLDTTLLSQMRNSVATSKSSLYIIRDEF